MLCCKGCVFDFGWKPGDTSVPDECIGCMVINGKPTKFKPKPKSNADRIRAMTDEALCDFLSQYQFCDICEEGCEKCRYNGDCERRLADWLKQPAEGDA